MKRFLPSVRKSISSLGYIQREYDTSLAIMLEAYEGRHPNKIARLYRSTGKQLTAEEKKQAGISRRSFFSIEAWQSLTTKGRLSPMSAHAVTLLDARLSLRRDEAIETGTRAKATHFQVHGTDFKDCSACMSMDGKIVDLEHAKSIRPNSCAREACGLTLSVCISGPRRFRNRSRG